MSDIGQFPIIQHTPAQRQGGAAPAGGDGLRDLLALVNDPERADVNAAPTGDLRIPIFPENAASPRKLGRVVNPAFNAPVTGPTALVPQPDAYKVLNVGPTPALPPVDIAAPEKLFFTGQIGTGKDYLASQIGATVIGVADPLYELVNFMFGLNVSADAASKTTPGVRKMLQRLGQWGRGEVTAEYPLTEERWLITETIRSRPWERGKATPSEVFLSVSWDSFGRDENIWLESALRRADLQVASGHKPVAVTNVRFTNEFKAFHTAGWAHFHVMASELTLAKRRGPNFNQAALADVSEQLAKRLDADVMKRLTQPGGRLRVVWNDTPTPRTERLLTSDQFCGIFKP